MGWEPSELTRLEADVHSQRKANAERREKRDGRDVPGTSPNADSAPLPVKELFDQPYAAYAADVKDEIDVAVGDVCDRLRVSGGGREGGREGVRDGVSE